MNLIPTRPSPFAKVLVLMALVFITLSCHKKTSQLGTEGAVVARATPSKTNAPNTEATAAKENAAVDATPTVASTTRPHDRHGRTSNQQSISYGAERASETVAAARERVAATDPHELVAQATELLKRARRADVPRYQFYGYVSHSRSGVVAPDYSRTSDYRAAAATAQNAIDLLKSQPVPTELAEKQKYSRTLVAALSVRAQALGLLAAQDRVEAGNAEVAYREYVAAESDEAKRTRAEYDLAALFYKLEEFEKAKVAYEQLLARNEDDRRALAALAQIHEKLAAAEKAAGDTTKAEADLASAKDYTQRLRDVNSPSRTNDREASSTTASSTEDRKVNADKRVNVDERVIVRDRAKVPRKEASAPPNAKKQSAIRP